MPPFPAASLEATMTPSRSAVNVGELARQFGRQVFHAAWRVLGDNALAEDVQQDVFVRLLEARDLDGVASWPAWLNAMATRLAINRLRRQRRWWQILPLWRDSVPAHAPSAEQHADQHERAARLRAALASLNPKQAQCFALRHLQGLGIPEIAALLSISENLVSVNLHRATRSLTARLGDTRCPGDRS